MFSPKASTKTKLSVESRKDVSLASPSDFETESFSYLLYSCTTIKTAS